MRDVDTLISELNQETENATMHIAPDSSAGGGDHFDEHREEPPAPDPEKPAEEPITKSAAQSTAKFFVNMISGMMKMIFVPLYKYAILEPGDIKTMKDLRQKHKGATDKEVEEVISSNDKLWPVVNRFDQYMDAVKAVAFTEEEKEMLIEPLADCIVHYNWKLSPGWMLGLALCMVMLPRFTRMIPNEKSDE